MALHPEMLLGRSSAGQAFVLRWSLPRWGQGFRGLRSKVWNSSVATPRLEVTVDWARDQWRWRRTVWALSCMLEFKACGTGPELHNTNIVTSSNEGTLETKC